MIAKPKKVKTSTLQKKADRLLQELGRKTYRRCICGGKYSCLHHFITKGASANLRYDWDNLIPVCQKCHFTFHHKDDPEIYEMMINWMGPERLERIKKKRRVFIKTDANYYRTIIEGLEKALK